LSERFDELRGLKLAFVGDGNNVAHSLMLTALRLGVNFSIATPSGYQPHPDVVASARSAALVSGASLLVTNDPEQAVAGANAVYTDVWTSMGQENERDHRLTKFAPFQVNAELLKKAPPHAIVLHCLPAHRGEEITADVLEGPRSRAFQQAGNRLHAQKALLAWLMG
jgi:ornithine carbamoyltransferase